MSHTSAPSPTTVAYRRKLRSLRSQTRWLKRMTMGVLLAEGLLLGLLILYKDGNLPL